MLKGELIKFHLTHQKVIRQYIHKKTRAAAGY